MAFFVSFETKIGAFWGWKAGLPDRKTMFLKTKNGVFYFKKTPFCRR